jgi:hypothetical protein
MANIAQSQLAIDSDTPSIEKGGDTSPPFQGKHIKAGCDSFYMAG